MGPAEQSKGDKEVIVSRAIVSEGRNEKQS